MRKQFLVISALVFIFGTLAFGQSIDVNRPTPITGNILEGTVKGGGTHYYSLRARQGSLVIVRVDLSSPGLFGGEVAFSLDFRGKAGTDGGQTACCKGGDYLPLSAPTKKLETSFTVVTNNSFLMMLNFGTTDRSPLTYKITFEGLESSDINDDSESADTITVDGRSGNDWVDTGVDIKKGDKVVLSATGSVDVSAGWGFHDAKGTRDFADVAGYPVKSPRRYGLAGKIGSQKWAFNGASITATKNGRLYLTCNDDAPGDNEGEFVVKVKIIRNRNSR
jgi:hypothetical protein